MHTLVVDDSRTMRLIIGQILREIGMEVLEAADGVQALEQLKRNPVIELVLLDWNMPTMNGLDFVRAIRADRAYDSLCVLMVTSEAQSEKVIEALKAGANEYLMKPFSKEVLLAKLNLLDVYQE
jgi:two-component system chemotaxis response regulator CheY